MQILKCRPISKGKVKGELLRTTEPLSFLGGVDPETGYVIDHNHELKGQNIKNKILLIPGGKGSTVGSYVIFQMAKNKTAPSAILCVKTEPIIVTGAIMADIPMVDKISDLDLLESGIDLEIDAEKGEIIIL